MRVMRGRCAYAALFMMALAASACELTEITLATPADVIIAEVILRAGADRQFAYLHRTAGTSGSARVFGAAITVTEEDGGRTLLYEVAADSLCIRDRGSQSEASLGTCYVVANTRDVIRPGAAYALRIEVENRVMTAHTQMPGTFRLIRPPGEACGLVAQDSLELVWTRAAGAWVYVTEGRFIGLRQALRRAGVQVPGTSPVELTGLSVSGADTTLVFPSELGLFDRFDEDLHPILLALQAGLPADVDTELTIGAADRNYVNWVRGGTFNPSGQVRVPSIQGQGTGVFGSVVPVQVRVETVANVMSPPCG